MFNGIFIVYFQWFFVHCFSFSLVSPPNSFTGTHTHRDTQWNDVFIQCSHQTNVRFVTAFRWFVILCHLVFRISVLFSRHQGNNKNKKKLCTNCVCTVYCTINARAYLITITICSCLLIFIYVTKIILLRITKRANEVKPGQEDRRTDRERESVSSFNCFTTFSYSNLIVTCEELQTFSSFLFCHTMEIIIKKTLKTKLVVKWLINEEIWTRIKEPSSLLTSSTTIESNRNECFIFCCCIVLYFVVYFR